MFLLRKKKKMGLNDLGASYTKKIIVDGCVLKTAYAGGEDKLIREIEWYIENGNNENCKIHLPELVDYSTEEASVFLKIKYYDLPTLRTLIFEKEIDDIKLYDILIQVFAFLNNGIYKKEARAVFDDYIWRAHLNKATNRLLQVSKKSKLFRDIFKKENIRINGKNHINIPYLIELLKKDSTFLRTLTPEKLHVIHGDLHLNNILFSIREDNFILLDPRGISPAGTRHCDICYDVAKIYHDLHGYYSIIDKGLFKIEISSRHSDFFIYSFSRLDILDLFDKFYPKLSSIFALFTDKPLQWQKRTLIIETFLFITMIPFHLKDTNKALMLYLRGAELLNDLYYKRLYI